MGLEQALPAKLVGRVFLSFRVLALPLAAWFFLRQANPGQDHVAMWSLLIAHNIFFLHTFLSFYLSLTVCSLAAGLWLRYLAQPRPLLWWGVLAGFFLAAWWRNAEFRRLAVAAGLFAVYWALPEGYGDGAYFDIRDLPVLFVLILAAAQTGAWNSTA